MKPKWRSAISITVSCQESPAVDDNRAMITQPLRGLLHDSPVLVHLAAVWELPVTGTFVMVELSLPGTFAPWNIRSLELSLPGTSVLWNFRFL